MKYGYARVSSRGQQKYGNSLEAQEKTLLEHGCDIVCKEAFTGTKTDRPVFDEVLYKLQEGDTLMVTKLDRFARTAVEGVTLIQDLVNKGIIVEILNMGRADNTPVGKLMLQIMFAFAEFERDMIVERFTEGKEIARSKGKRTEGRRSKEIPDFQKFLKKQKDGQMTIKECCEILGISRTLWYNRVRKIA